MADTRTVQHMGETIGLSKLVAHYRAMAHREPQSAPFWRMRLRVVIAQARWEAASADERIAA